MTNLEVKTAKVGCILTKVGDILVRLEPNLAVKVLTMLNKLRNYTFIPTEGHMESCLHFIQHKSPVRRPFCTV